MRPLCRLQLMSADGSMVKTRTSLFELREKLLMHHFSPERQSSPQFGADGLSQLPMPFFFHEWRRKSITYSIDNDSIIGPTIQHLCWL
jgi:hypothetical protein